MDTKFGFDNVIAGNGVSITLSGMAIVFCGLILISLYIGFLPHFLAWMDGWLDPKKRANRQKTKEKNTQSLPSSPTEDLDLLAAINYVIEAEIDQEDSMDNQRITMRRSEGQHDWYVAGKMRNISGRRLL
jgi:oxaloacetate decarboxylase gamma subunit